MPISPIEEVVEDLRQGRMIILVDDPDRENEGDLAMLADAITPEAINFMAKEGRGLICMPMSGEVCDRLELGMPRRPIWHVPGTFFLSGRGTVAFSSAVVTRSRWSISPEWPARPSRA